MKVFVFYNCRTYPTKATYLNYLYSFRNYSEHEVYYQNFYYDQSMDFYNKIKPDLVIFYLLVFWDKTDYEMKIESLKQARMENTVKAAFFQDEYSRTLYSVKLVNELNIPFIFSVAPKSEWDKIYSGIRKGTVIKHVLTTYIDDKDIEKTKGVEESERNIDISYRTALDSPYHIGRFGLLKKEIGTRVKKEAEKFDLRTDISTNEKGMKFGNSWFDFLLKSKYVLGMESGASLHDRDGSIFKRVKSYLKENPQASFEVTEKNCFPGQDGNLALKAISPRHFEACLTKTCQVLIEGEYNGILQPWIHYLPLKKDFSNIDDILSIVNKDKQRSKIVKKAFEDVARNEKYRYRTFIPDFYSFVMKNNQILIQNHSKKNYLAINKFFDSWSWFVAYLVPRSHFFASIFMRVYFKFKKTAVFFLSKMRILHCPKNWGGNPKGLVKAERSQGMESRLIVFEKDSYGFKADECIDSKNIIIKELKRWSLLIRALLFYDVVHFNAGSSIMPDLTDVNRYKPNSIASRIYYKYIQFFTLKDLPLLKLFKKKIIVTFFGDDARQGEYCKKNYRYTFANEVKEGYYLKHLDEYKKKKIALFEKYAYAIYYTNPDLRNFLPGRSKFLPYTGIFPDEIKPAKRIPDNIPVILHAPSNREVKGTKYILHALDRLKKEGIKYKLVLIEKKSNSEVLDLMRSADLLIDQVLLGWYGTIAVEAMAHGIAVLCYIREEDLKYVPTQLARDLPVIMANPNNVYHVLKRYLTINKHLLTEIGNNGRSYVKKWHNPIKIAAELNKST